MINYSRMIKKFILGEQKEPPSIDSHLQALGLILNSFSPSTIKEKRNIDISLFHLKEIRRMSRRLYEEIYELKEQINILEEKHKKGK